MSLLTAIISFMITYAKIIACAFVVNARLNKKPAQNTALDFARRGNAKPI